MNQQISFRELDWFKLNKPMQNITFLPSQAPPIIF